MFINGENTTNRYALQYLSRDVEDHPCMHCRHTFETTGRASYYCPASKIILDATTMNIIISEQFCCEEHARIKEKREVKVIPKDQTVLM